MRRTIVEPAEISASALTDLKSWLGISRPNEDGLLLDLLRASIALCEAFIGQAPLSQLVEERLPVSAGRRVLSFQPVISFEGAQIIAQSGIRTAIGPETFRFSVGTDGSACFELLDDLDGQAIAVRARIGIAEVWENVPHPLKQGIIRFAAHQYRDRDSPASGKTPDTPPAIVTALWQPWRIMRLT